MIRFPITSFDSRTLTLHGVQGQPLSLDVGEVVRAEILNILASGEAIFRIKGKLITAESDVALQKGAVVYLKVLAPSSDREKIELRLISDTQEPAQAESPPDTQRSVLNRVLMDLSRALADKGRGGDLTQIIESLLKALPSDSSSLSADLRVQLQTLLQKGLKMTGQGIQTRLDMFLLSEMPEVMIDASPVERLKSHLMIAMEELLGDSLKESIEDTGVSLEAKLRLSLGRRETTAADTGSPSSTPEEREDGQTLPPQQKGGPSAHHGSSPVDRDLKGELLKLRHLLSEDGGEGSPELRIRDLTQDQRNKLTKAIDGIIRDIETFQALSKTTDSLYTFLPLRWRELRDGEIVFRRGRTEKGEAAGYSCRLNLDLEGLRKVTAVIVMNTGDFLVSLSVEHRGLQAALDSHSRDLQESFRQQGLHLKTCTVLEKSGPALDHLERLASFEKIVNIKA